MKNLESRMSALEQAGDRQLEIVRTGSDGVARGQGGRVMPHGWDRHGRIIRIVRSYGTKL